MMHIEHYVNTILYNLMEYSVCYVSETWGIYLHFFFYTHECVYMYIYMYVFMYVYGQ